MKRFTLVLCAVGMFGLSGASLLSMNSESANAGNPVYSNMRCITTSGGLGCFNTDCIVNAWGDPDTPWWDYDQPHNGSRDYVNAAEYGVCGDPGVSTSCEIIETERRCATKRSFWNLDCTGEPHATTDKLKTACRTLTHQGPGGGTGGPGPIDLPN